MNETRLPPWSVPITVHEVSETGRRFELVADQNVRAAVAQAIGVQALPRLEATFDVTRHGRAGLRVAGQVSATVQQACVVTLEPVENTVEEAVDLLFTPPAAATPDDGAGTRKRVAPDEAPEAMSGESVDLGSIATEFLTLGLDPYPRKPGVVFEAPATADEGAHPFAALAALKKGRS